MIKSKIAIFFLILSTSLLFSCQETFLGKDPENTPRNNFESLWKTVDQKYSYFSYKRINWDSIYTVYTPQINNDLNDIELFNILFKMLGELRDAHVNLISGFNVSRYDKIFSNSPENFDDQVVSNNYLEDDYYITGPFLHQSLALGTVGYIRYSSFSNEISGGDLDFILSRFKNSKGIILDVRNNGGGYVSNVFKICSRFTDQKRPIFSSYIKCGPGHNDFSGPNPAYIEPSMNPYTKKVFVLTNRNCYSSTSFLVLAMREFPNVTILGDTTGGGLGSPSGAELPNGWAYRFSSSMTVSPRGENFEDGIPPDITIYLKATDTSRGHDTMIDKAVSIINSN
jgi:hypothetical protein